MCAGFRDSRQDSSSEKILSFPRIASGVRGFAVSPVHTCGAAFAARPPNSFYELLRGLLVAVGFDFERAGVRPCDEGGLFRPGEAQALGPGVFPLHRAEAGPAMEILDHARDIAQIGWR